MRSSCRITFTGLNLSRLVNSICSYGIAVYGVERNGKNCVIEVPHKHCKQVVALLRERCYNIVKTEYTGSFAALRFIQKRYLVVVAALLCIVAFAVSSQFCQKISVTGDFAESDVLSALAEFGVRKGVSLSSVKVDALENAVANRLDAMYVVVNRKGSALYVNAVKRKTIDSPIDIHSRRDIVSTSSGKVTSVFCEQGLPVVKIGDFVEKGDVLIEGTRLFNDGSREDAYALGTVTIEVTSTAFCEFNGVKCVVERTGNRQSAQNVVLFGKSYGKPCKYDMYECEISVYKLYPLNLEVQTLTYYETVRVSVPSTVDECVDELTALAKESAMRKCDFEVLNTDVEVKTNGVQVTLYGEAVVN